MSQRWIEVLGGCWVAGLTCLGTAGCTVDDRTPDIAEGGAGGASGNTAGSSGSAGSSNGSPSSDLTAGSGGSSGSGECSDGADAGCTCLSDGGLSCPVLTPCSGCSIEGSCIAPGVTATLQPCLVCDPARSTSAWSDNDGADCEDAQFCTVEDSCLGGVCLAGRLRTCPTNEVCSNDACVPVPQPFVCEDADPPAPFPVAVRDNGAAPEPEGGSIVPGTYTMTQVRVFGDFTSVRGEGLVLRGNFVHRNSTTYQVSSGSAIAGFRQIGTFTTTGTALGVDTENCGIVGSIPSIWGYTASGTQLQLFKQDYGFLSIETYLLQP